MNPQQEKVVRDDHQFSYRSFSFDIRARGRQNLGMFSKATKKKLKKNEFFSSTISFIFKIYFEFEPSECDITLCVKQENGGSDCDEDVPRNLSDCYSSGNSYLGFNSPSNQLLTQSVRFKFILYKL